MSKESFLFTSESVTCGHPDKLCDQLSDAILDAHLEQDPLARVAIETAVKDNFVFILGELTSRIELDIQSLARQVIRDIGYDDPALGFCADTCQIVEHISQQSPNIAQGINISHNELGAGDQGIMFGYADLQTPMFMPLPIVLAHQLARRLEKVRRNNIVEHLRPDGKAQVTVKYVDGQPQQVTAIVLSSQHAPQVSMDQLREELRTQVVDMVVDSAIQAEDMVVHINPTGRFEIGGPVGDSGLTGRKIIVDTYGGWSRHGGGAFSGKDPTKVDRSAAYAARQAAKSVVANGWAKRCEIQLAYAIGLSHPASIHVETFGTNTISEASIRNWLEELDFQPAAIIKRLQLRQPIYKQTAAYGHFGRAGFSWEKTIDAKANQSPQPAWTNLGVTKVDII